MIHDHGEESVTQGFYLSWEHGGMEFDPLRDGDIKTKQQDNLPTVKLIFSPVGSGSSHLWHHGSSGT